jgi:hypothetical protein
MEIVAVVVCLGVILIDWKLNKIRKVLEEIRDRKS